MTITDHILLALCGLALAAIVGYAFWIKIRTLWLRIDLMEIYADLRDQVATVDGLRDKGYTEAVERLAAGMAFADHLSLPVMVHLLMIARTRDVAVEVPRSDDPRIEAEVTQSLERANQRIARYGLYHTLSGLILRAIAKTLALPTRFLRKEAERDAGRTMESLQAIQGSLPRTRHDSISVKSC